MAHNAALPVMGQGAQMHAENGVREQTMQMLRRVMIVTAICLSLVVLLSKRDSLIQMIDHPVSSIKVTGTFSYLNEGEVTQALSGLVGTGFIATDLQELQSRVERLPWVDRATVSRAWPGAIKLLINEQVAVSQWNEGALLNAEGVVFKPSELSPELLVLPTLIGSEHFSVAKKTMMFSTLKVLQQALADYGLSIASLELKPRNVWNMALTNGVMVAMGEIRLDDAEGQQTLDAKLERVGKVFSARASIETNNIARIDARYPNGVAIRWRSEKSKK